MSSQANESYWQDDQTLWELVKRGDAAAFGVIYDRHIKAIYNHSFRATANWSEAEEAASAVFLEAWRCRSRALITPSSGILPWLLAVNTNLLRNTRRSRGRYLALLRRLPVIENQPDFSDQADERMDDERRMRSINNLLDRIPSREREVLAFWAWDRLTYAEIAEALGLPIGTVRSRIHRGVRRLRKLSEGDPLLGSEHLPREEAKWATD